jgi:hypothetical protein
MKSPKKQIEALLEEAGKRGFTPMWTHYHRRNKKGEKVLGATTCLLLDESGVVASRGAAVVGKGDVPSKVEGRRRSIRRAFRTAVASEVVYQRMQADEIVWDKELAKDVDRRMIPTKKIEGLDRYVTKFVKKPDMSELSAAEMSRILAWTKRMTDKKLAETA